MYKIFRACGETPFRGAGKTSPTSPHERLLKAFGLLAPQDQEDHHGLMFQRRKGRDVACVYWETRSHKPDRETEFFPPWVGIETMAHLLERMPSGCGYKSLMDKLVDLPSEVGLLDGWTLILAWAAHNGQSVEMHWREKAFSREEHKELEGHFPTPTMVEGAKPSDAWDF